MGSLQKIVVLCLVAVVAGVGFYAALTYTKPPKEDAAPPLTAPPAEVVDTKPKDIEPVAEEQKNEPSEFAPPQGSDVGMEFPIPDDERDPEMTACTMDAKLCPDGSYVGRVPPDCAFAACPGEEETAHE